ncbi:MAG TPA: helix-hairpin-helix domain-containing protein [Thermoanaerobaculia bacterium]|nr:helix-hairpin-helix domain-containing protein [Thermoanaerobaculia bacterium]
MRGSGEGVLAGRGRRKRRGRPPVRFLHYRKRCPLEVRLWLRVGLVPKSARALAEAGYHALADLGGATREQLLAIPGVGTATLKVLEETLGSPIPAAGKRRASPPVTRPWPEMVWRRRGVPPSAAITFAQEGMTLERLSSISREELLDMVGVGPGTIRACELIVGRRIPSQTPAKDG